MNTKLHIFLLTGIIVLLIWSSINPYSRFTWYLEVAPAVIGIGLLIGTYRRWKFTDMVYILIAIECGILIVGGHYTYAKVPLFDYIQEIFGFSRNHYDRVGHFAQGFIPAMIVRELFIRLEIVRGRGWKFAITTMICLAISAIYELIEFVVAKITETGAEAFLGTQGDVWDTQWDMLLALMGAMIAQAVLGRWHDREIEKLREHI